MTDDDGKRASMDIDVDLHQAPTKAATAWTHFVLAVSRNYIQAYIDGTVATASWCLVPEDDANLYDGVGGSNYGTPGAANLVCAVPVD